MTDEQKEFIESLLEEQSYDIEDFGYTEEDFENGNLTDMEASEIIRQFLC